MPASFPNPGRCASEEMRSCPGHTWPTRLTLRPAAKSRGSATNPHAAHSTKTRRSRCRKEFRPDCSLITSSVPGGDFGSRPTTPQLPRIVKSTMERTSTRLVRPLGPEGSSQLIVGGRQPLRTSFLSVRPAQTSRHGRAGCLQLADGGGPGPPSIMTRSARPSGTVPVPVPGRPRRGSACHRQPDR